MQKKLSQFWLGLQCCAGLVGWGLREHSQVAKAVMCSATTSCCWQDIRGRGAGLGLCPMSAAAALSLQEMQLADTESL